MLPSLLLVWERFGALKDRKTQQKHSRIGEQTSEILEELDFLRLWCLFGPLLRLWGRFPIQFRGPSFA